MEPPFDLVLPWEPGGLPSSRQDLIVSFMIADINLSPLRWETATLRDFGLHLVPRNAILSDVALKTAIQ